MKVAMTLDFTKAERELIAFFFDAPKRANRGKRKIPKRLATRIECRKYVIVGLGDLGERVGEHRYERAAS